MFGHPVGLRTLFFTEMWERLSYYGMRGLLILFMTETIEKGGFSFGTETAGAIYGLYTAGVYLLALPGGWIADRILGQRDAVFIGGVVIAVGHFSMAVPTKFSFFAGLILIAIGTGLLKPNVSAIVADLYPEGGARRDAGFSIFYMGINIGAFAGPLICSYLGENINWHLGFSAAGIGMVFGLIQYKLGLKDLGEAGKLKSNNGEERSAAMSILWKALGVLAAVIAGFWISQVTGITHLTLVNFAQGTAYLILVTIALFFGYILIFQKWSKTEKMRIGMIFFLFIGAALFWSGFEQAGSSMNLFANSLTERHLFGWEVPAGWLQSVNPLFIIIMAPLFGSLWIWLGSKEPSIPVKFAFGLVFLGAGFFVMAWAATYASATNKVAMTWLVVTYFLHTSGELCLSPVGLSSVTKLSPKPLVGQMMGVWFMGSALGNLIAGLAGGKFESLPLPGLFGNVAWMALIGGGFFFLLMKPMKKLIGEVK
ncbi:MAG: MFS transporter [Caldithrix sp.]|nr:MAG: MFS transporter [Caldithrix sp.]